MKVKNDHHSNFAILSNWKEAWKIESVNGIRTRDLRYTGTILYQLSYEASLSTCVAPACSTTFNTDKCSLALAVNYANNPHSYRGPTFEKNLFVWRLCQERLQRRF